MYAERFAYTERVPAKTRNRTTGATIFRDTVKLAGDARRATSSPRTVSSGKASRAAIGDKNRLVKYRVYLLMDP